MGQRGTYRVVSSLIALTELQFSYSQSSEPLLSGVTAVFPLGFTAVVGANGCGKSTLLKLMAGELRPDSGELSAPLLGRGLDAQAVYCEQRTDEPPVQLADFLNDWEPEAFALRGRLDVPDDALDRWSSLSHGERKRVQIACALWQQPELLLIDEPTNHIDSVGRTLLENALARFSGTGVIVSHDRELLDALCVQTLWLERGVAYTFSGGYSDAVVQREQQKLSAQRHRDKLKAGERRLQTEAARRRERAGRADAMRSKRGIAAKDSDARDKIDRARVSGKDGTAGKLLRQLDGRIAQNAEALSGSEVNKEYATGIWVAGEASQANALFTRPAGQIELGAGRTLTHDDLLMRPTDRIALTGDNGAGKSTLVSAIVDSLNLPPEKVVLMPQEVSATRSVQLLKQAVGLPNAELGQVMSIVRRLGSNPGRLIESAVPSPGEIRKLLLALGIVQTPHLLILDEPTNHLDVLAIESLESALAGCPCGLLIVSHDKRLVQKLTTIEWVIERDADSNSRLRSAV